MAFLRFGWQERLARIEGTFELWAAAVECLESCSSDGKRMDFSLSIDHDDGTSTRCLELLALLDAAEVK